MVTMTEIDRANQARFENIIAAIMAAAVIGPRTTTANEFWTKYAEMVQFVRQRDAINPSPAPPV